MEVTKEDRMMMPERGFERSVADRPVAEYGMGMSQARRGARGCKCPRNPCAEMRACGAAVDAAKALARE